MKFADQITRRADQTLTKDGGVISPSLWLPSNSELNVKSATVKCQSIEESLLICLVFCIVSNETVKMSEGRRVPLDLFGVLHSELNCKSVRR